jgi:hypothetical protein
MTAGGATGGEILAQKAFLIERAKQATRTIDYQMWQ